jgi:hypothetical protein
MCIYWEKWRKIQAGARLLLAGGGVHDRVGEETQSGKVASLFQVVHSVSIVHVALFFFENGHVALLPLVLYNILLPPIENTW